ncbi:MAG TPA: hypothetical protein VNN76_06035 [Bacteroidota bacterium]|nr:hypothetical protein [Bacteroidota bacterium]
MNFDSSPTIHLIIRHLNEIAADAYRHRIRPSGKHGGGGTYDGSSGKCYHMPLRLESNRWATFSIVALSRDEITLKAEFLSDPACWISAVVDSRGRLGNITFSPFFEAQEWVIQNIPPHDRVIKTRSERLSHS